MNKLVLGTVQLGLPYGINNIKGMPSIDESHDILSTAFSNGIKELDTAEAYGSSQEVIGSFHKKHNQKFEICTKLDPTISNPNEIIPRIKKLIDKLEVEKLNTCMLHHFNSYIENKEIFKQLEEAKNLGLIENIGISLYTNIEIEIICKDSLVDIVQMPFNLLDNCTLRNRAIEMLKEAGKTVHVRSIFLQGVFFRKRFSKNEKAALLLPYINKLQKISQKHNLSINEIAMNYAINHALIDKVLIGLESKEQLLQNINSSKSIINPSIYHEIEKIRVKDQSMLNPTNWK